MMKQSKPAVPQAIVTVQWGPRSFVLRLSPEQGPRPGEIRWRGRVGTIVVQEDRDIHGDPMVLAWIEFPEVLDPMDGAVHVVDGGYQQDAASAVAKLYERTEQIRSWLDGLPGDQK